MMLYPFDGQEPVVHASVFIAPTAVLVGRVQVKEQSSIWFHAMARGDINYITIGAQTNIQDGCLLHVTQRHPLTIGDRVTAGHGAILHGCSIASDCLIAMGAIILDGAILGSGCLVGAGSVVPPNMVVPPDSLVMGVPARVIRQLSDSDKEAVMRGWHNYVGLAESYRLQLAQQANK